MSQPAPKRTVVPPAPPPAALADKTGRFRRSTATLLPPAGAAADVVSPEEVGAQLELDAEQPERGIASGVFGKSGNAAKLADDELAAFADSLVPYYREGELRNERAQLEVEDLSLRLDNPYAASSLVPPAHGATREVPWRALIALGVGAAAVAGAFALGSSRGAERDEVRSTRLASKPSSAVAAAPVEAARALREAAPIPSASAAKPVEAPPQPAAPSPPKALKVAASSSAAPAIQAEPAAPAIAAAAPAAEVVPSEATETAAAESATEGDATQAAAAAALPEIPTRAEVSAGFDAVRGALQTCAAGKQGVVDIDATVAGSGRVTYALIDGVFKGSPEGSCMARAVRAARFPQFSRPSLKVSYPIAL